MTAGAQPELPLVQYKAPECIAQFTLDAENETFWASRSQIAELYGIAPNTLSEHVQKIFREGELEEEAVSRRIRLTGKDGKVYNSLHYNLDLILSVGYRVSSKRATAFRRWATQTLKDYLTKGYALNEALLRRKPEALRGLAARVRELRADERTMYEGVRDIFAFASTDYDRDAETARLFFAKLQDKFLYAITGQVASQVILQRADSQEPDMGLQTMKGPKPTQADARIGKNYLDQNELYELRILSEQFLLFVESRALRGKPLTMLELSAKFDELLRVQGHEVLDTYPPYYTRDRANRHVDQQLTAYKQRLRNGNSKPLTR
ncbi:MAG: virulence RhuM family protein [Rhodospirillales bacterium]|nr:virulence RhuM family protein [Acetobacter sp.]